jgi:hypothetical protein
MFMATGEWPLPKSSHAATSPDDGICQCVQIGQFGQVGPAIRTWLTDSQMPEALVGLLCAISALMRSRSPSGHLVDYEMRCCIQKWLIKVTDSVILAPLFRR